MSSFIIKIIAIITMLIDHTGDVISNINFNIIGRIAFPLFAFQLVIGYINTKDVYKYAKRLFIFALISEIPYALMFYQAGSYLNVFFTMFFGLACMLIYDSEKIKPYLKVLLVSAILIIAQFSKVDYFALGVAFIFAIYLVYKKCLIDQKNKKKHWKSLINSLALVTICLVFSISRYASYFNRLPLYQFLGLILGSFIPVFIMLMYNGKKGPSIKYFFYAFYPLHLTILCIIKYFII